MAGYFLDTSAIVKRYHREAGTEQIDALLSRRGSVFYISRLSLVEAVSAIALRVRLGEVSSQQPTHVRSMLLADIRHKQLNVARVLIRHWQRAEQLIDTAPRDGSCFSNAGRHPIGDRDRSSRARISRVLCFRRSTAL